MTDLEPIQRGAFLRELREAVTASPVFREADLLTEFLQRLNGRLEQGARDYGDTSPQKPFGVLLGEMEQELLDIAGWSCQAWRKVNASIGAGETLHNMHPKVRLAHELIEEAVASFWSFVMLRGRIAKLCKELDGHA